MAKITIFGLAGTGTSSTGKILAETLHYSYHSSGSMFRDHAKKLGLDVYQFVELCTAEPRYNRELDREIELFGKRNDDFVMESRLAWHFIPDSFKIKLVCDLDIRLARVSKRDGITI